MRDLHGVEREDAVIMRSAAQPLKRSRRFGSESGITIVELLIAAALFVITLASLAGVFLAATRGYGRTEQISEVQQETNTALNLLRYEVGLAGYRGTCILSAQSKSFSGSTFSVTKGTSTDTIVIRYFEDRFSSNPCGTERVVRYFVQDTGDGQMALFRAEDGGAGEPIVTGIAGLRLFRYVERNGGLPDSMPASGFVAVSVEVTYSDDTQTRFVIGLKNPQQNPTETTL